MTKATKKIVCACATHHRIPTAVIDRARRSGATIIDDLCGLAAKEPGALRTLLTNAESLTACHERAVKCLIEWSGATPPENLIDAWRGDAPEEKNTAGKWIPWFPVIDRGRCVNCGQCAEFCLFGVYANSANGKTEVVKPDACKTNCPACAKVCPRQAIIFPKHPEAPINGGEAGTETTSDLNTLLGDNPYQTLARRNRMAMGKLLKNK